MIRFAIVCGLAALSATASAADLRLPLPAGRFVATCEDLGTLCFAEACGRDQIDADLACRAQCPSAVTMSIVPKTCPLSSPAATVILDRRG